jgi:hypothetical protein
LQAVARPPAAPRILPSILEPVRSNSAVVEPVRGKRSPGSKLHRSQIEPDLNTIGSEGALDAPAETPVMSKEMSQMDAPPAEEGASQAQETERTKTKPPMKALKTVKPVTAPEPLSQPETASETQRVASRPVTKSRPADHRRHTRRQTAAAQLPRHERWKRRLHSAAW